MTRTTGHLRQGKSHQRSHHHDEIQDVPEVSEVGAILQDQALINHLEGRYREKSRQGMSSSDIKWKGQAGGQGHCRHISFFVFWTLYSVKVSRLIKEVLSTLESAHYHC